MYDVPLEHGNCPNCGVSLDGGGIWEHFFREFTVNGDWLDENGEYSDKRRLLREDEAMIRADEVAQSYGATRTKGRWGREIGLEFGRDRVEEYRCPDCGHQWPRK